MLLMNVILMMSLLVGGAASAEVPELGEPVLPPDSLRELVNGERLKPSLEKVKLIDWIEAKPEEEKLSFELLSAVNVPPAAAASLWIEPKTQKLSESAPDPRSCEEVQKERRQVRRWIRQVKELRDEIEDDLSRLERRCRRNDHCDWKELDGNLAELNAVVKNLRIYAEQEFLSRPDRLIVYYFHFDSSIGRKFLREGYVPVGRGIVTRMRFHRSPWINLVGGTPADAGGFRGPPAAGSNGKWKLARALSATEACATNLIFNLEFVAQFQKPQTGKFLATDTEGVVQADSSLPTENVLVRAISL